MKNENKNKQTKTKKTKTYGQMLREARGTPHGKKRKKAAKA